MLAIRAERGGGSEVLAAVDLPVPTARGNSVLVRLQAIGVNFADVMCRSGTHPGMPSPPIVLGCEGSGIVESIGDKVSRFQGGERVGVYSPWGGTYAHWVTVPEDYALPIPDSMGFDEAAAFTHVYLTAYHAIRTLGRAQRGDWLVVTAAAGGLGTAIIQLCRAWGIRVIAGVGSDSKFDLLHRLGVEDKVNYSRERLTDRVEAITRRGGADVVIETVGGDVFADACKCVAEMGRVVIAGTASGVPPRVDILELLSKSATCSTLNLSVLFAYKPDLVLNSWSELMNIYVAREVNPIIGHLFPIAEARRAHELMESRNSRGKILLTL